MNLDLLLLILSWCCLILGGVLTLISAIGCYRMPDFYTQLHAASVGDSCGVPMILFGLALQSGFNIFSAKLIMIIIILLITNPTACYALAKSALLHKLIPFEKGQNDK